MVKNHMKRLTVPKTWKGVLKKEKTFSLKPLPGAHSLRLGLPLGAWFKLKNYAKSSREVKKILNAHNILVNGKRIKNVKFSVGLFDTLFIEPTGESFRVVFDMKGHLKLKKEEKDRINLKPSKVIGKTVVKKGILQVNLADSRNFLTKEKINVGDTVVLSLPEHKVVEVLPFRKNSEIVLIGGKRIGSRGRVKDLQGDNVIYESNGEIVKTLKNYAYVIKEEFIK